MEARYQSVLDELHTNKRQLAQYRQRHFNLEAQLLSQSEQSRSLKKTISNLKEQNQNLQQQNAALINEKQTLIAEYSSSIDSIKEQIEKKQQEIFALRENSYSPMMNQKLIEKQIRCQVESEYEDQLEEKEKRISQLQTDLDRSNFERQIDKEKFELKVESLDRELKEMQNAHLAELQNYANKTYQNSQNVKVSEEQSLIKRLRREIDQLRMTLDQNRQELSECVDEKNKIHREYTATVAKNMAQKEELLEELGVFKRQCERLGVVANKNRAEKDQYLVKQKQKYIKELKDVIEEQRSELHKKQKKISEWEIESLNLTNELKRVKEFNFKNENEKVQEIKTEKEKLVSEINEMKETNETIRRSNIELMNSLTEIQTKSVKEIQENKHSAMKKGLSQTKKRNSIFASDQKVVIREQSGDSEGEENNQETRLINRYKSEYQSEHKKNRQLSEKYVELKKKYKNLEIKFKEANAKVVDLLKNKIQLGSPKATPHKVFHFPAPNHKSPQHAHNGSGNFYQTADNVRRPERQLRHALQSPEQTTLSYKKADRSVSSSKGDQSFYQKSLKVKNSHKFKELRCLNHEQTQGQRDHSRSLSKPK